MAKKTQDNHTPSSTATLRQKPKKQTKKESKVQLAIEQVQASLAKAQSKLEKLQARIDERTSLLHKLETKLAHMNNASPVTDADVSNRGSNHQQEPEAKMPNMDAPVVSTPDTEIDAPNTSEESQAVSDPSIQQAVDEHNVTQADVAATVDGHAATQDDAAVVVDGHAATQADAQTSVENVTTRPESSETPPTTHETSDQEPTSGMRPQKRVPLSDLKGLVPQVKTKLESEGITNTQQFLEQTRTQQQRTELANKVDTTPDAILEWANRADLMRLRGVGGVFATMLEEAGIHSCRELQQSDPEQLFKTLETINIDKKIGHHIPTLAQVTEWTAEANTLAETSPE